MNKLFAVVITLLLSASAFAHDYGYREGPGYRHDHRGHGGQSIGREIVEIGVGGAIAIAAVQVGAAIGGRVAQEVLGTPAQQSGRVVYVVPVCDQTPVLNGGLIYADRCDGNGRVVIGSVDRR